MCLKPLAYIARECWVGFVGGHRRVWLFLSPPLPSFAEMEIMGDPEGRRRQQDTRMHAGLA